jgi:tryptophan synthase alpha subunit
MGVTGSPMQITDLVEEVFEAGLGGVFAVDLQPDEDRSPLDEISEKHIINYVELG